jgi:hypothetical protein
MKRIDTKERLRKIMGQPLPIVPKKIHRQLNAKAIEFIQKSGPGRFSCWHFHQRRIQSQAGQT